MDFEIELGDKVQDIHTGFTGIVVAKTEFINGCVQFSVAPPWDKKSTLSVEEVCIDEQSLKILKKKKQPEEIESSGGATRRGVKMRGY